MSRVFNFSAGPAMIPEAVIKKASEEMLEWNNEGMSVMEISHRGKAFMSIASKAEANLRTLMSIPDNYKVLFLQGGASQQFSAIPLNLLGDKTSADYVNTGMWSKKAIAEAKKYCTVNVVASSEDSGFTTIPDFSSWTLNPDAAYVHYTPNETIGGVEFDYIPDTGNVPLIADLSSTILSRPIDVSKFAMIYAGAQKNVGPAGLTLVIIREDLLGNASAMTPTMLNYKTHAETDSMYNTPPTYSWYLAGLVFEWLLEKGGLEGISAINKSKAEKLYAAIDKGDFYANPVEIRYRSWMNIPFTLKDASLDAEFLEQAAKKGLATLKGHRSVGGMRASIYNAMPEEGIDTLVEFMNEFAQANS
ncbi:3-phosphoserine/phosphohydroxythreonine transaminase [sulfur-oxidizing endosymbiont of Gigantopelta aegis]|uniref:3-phosphoserine/phosphohydroxythreonine transaminase n=1 Tax=sulfur-oxidizing endosymbiont of Gigantopelta aegis TaxID=2794934 RepID=UPI0018DC232D|nr:3-phosphoserine/phosphohydroxythreonine transaminase [sulfur-oxidizing endosymbiont of Gigantopelta aegis]